VAARGGIHAAQRRLTGTAPESAGRELGDERPHALRDLVAERANFFEGPILRIGKLPVDVPLSRRRAGLVPAESAVCRTPAARANNAAPI
jgi:hypothetical protein